MSFDTFKSAVAERAGLTKTDTDKALSAFIEQLQTTLGEGEKVTLPGLGQFDVAERSERQGRNPRTGETITIPASKGIRFKAGKALKDAVNG